jgi:hypothetical protein
MPDMPDMPDRMTFADVLGTSTGCQCMAALAAGLV